MPVGIKSSTGTNSMAENLKAVHLQHAMGNLQNESDNPGLQLTAGPSTLQGRAGRTTAA